MVALVLVLGLMAADRAPQQHTATASEASGDPTETSTPAGADAESSADTQVDHPLRSFTFAATGDFLLHAPVQRQGAENAGGAGYSFAPMLTVTSPIISGVDLAICHMETPVSEDDTSLSGYPVFNVPREIAADAKAAGYDGCDTASNHTLDKGAAGVASTLDVLDAAGLKHTGSFRSALDAVTPTIYDVHGIKFGHLAYAYGTNGIPMPADKPWSLNLIDANKILADAAATKQAGADFVAVSLHWGNEYQSAPTPDQQALAHQLLRLTRHRLHHRRTRPRRAADREDRRQVRRLRHGQLPVEPGLTQHPDAVAGRHDPASRGEREQPDGSFKATKVDYTPTWVDRSNFLVTLATPQANKASYERTVAAITSLGPLAYQGEPIFTAITADPGGLTRSGDLVVGSRLTSAQFGYGGSAAQFLGSRPNTLQTMIGKVEAAGIDHHRLRRSPQLPRRLRVRRFARGPR